MTPLAEAWPILLLILAVAALATGMMLRLQAKGGGPVKPWSPTPVPPEEIELVEGPITACLRCGSLRVRTANLNEGGIPGGGEGLAWICDRCGKRGPALEFEDATAYREFVKSLHEGEDAPALR